MRRRLCAFGLVNAECRVDRPLRREVERPVRRRTERRRRERERYALAQPVFDNAATFTGATANLTGSYTVTGANVVLYAVTNRRVADGFTNSGCTYNGVAMTQLGVTEAPSSSSEWKLWRLIAPATGANTFAAVSSGGTANIVAAVWSASGVDQTTPEGAIIFKSSNSAITISQAITISATQIALSFCMTEDTGGTGTFTATGSTQTLRGSIALGNQGVGVGDQTATGSVTASYSYSRSSPDVIGIWVIPVNAGAAAAGPPLFLPEALGQSSLSGIH